MREAFSEARLGRGRTGSNPCVGAIVFKDGKIIGRGSHPGAGKPHAEPLAIAEAGELARGADLYVSLEPCSHQGRTPPCVQALIDAGIHRVFFSCKDPNPKVSGNGERALKNAGIQVFSGLLEDEGKEILQGWFCCLEENRSRVRVKAAMTLGGQMAPRSGDSRWITSELARKKVHQIRNQVSAVLVGAQTAIQDDPSLTIRDVSNQDNFQPKAVLIDPNQRVPVSRKIFRPETIVVTKEGSSSVWKDQMAEKEVSVIELPVCENQEFPLDKMLEELAQRDVQEILVEGGGRTIGAFLKQSLVDHFDLFYAPKILGPSGFSFAEGFECEFMNQAVEFEWTRLSTFSPDFLVEARVRSFQGS